MTTIEHTSDITPPIWIQDLDRVTTDITNEHLDPGNYDCLAIAAEMRTLAGDQPLDKVADDAWVELLAWHMRAPMPAEVAR